MSLQGRGGVEPTTEPAVMICEDECCSIGRGETCNLILDEPSVSTGTLGLSSCSSLSHAPASALLRRTSRTAEPFNL